MACAHTSRTCLARGWMEPMGPKGSPPSTAVMTEMFGAAGVASPPTSCASRRAAVWALIAAGELRQGGEVGAGPHSAP